MEYPKPPLRRCALELHKGLLRIGRELERARDVGLACFVALVTLVAVGLGGATWLPIVNSDIDFLIWVVLWVTANIGLCLLLRRARRRRYGNAPSTDLPARRNALELLLAGWIGVLALSASIGAILTSDSYSFAVGAGLVAAGLLVPVVIVSYRYVTRPPDYDPDSRKL